MGRSKTPKSKPGRAGSTALDSRTAVFPRPRQCFIYEGLVDQLLQMPASRNFTRQIACVERVRYTESCSSKN